MLQKLRVALLTQDVQEGLKKITDDFVTAHAQHQIDEEARYVVYKIVCYMAKCVWYGQEPAFHLPDLPLKKEDLPCLRFSEHLYDIVAFTNIGMGLDMLVPIVFHNNEVIPVVDIPEMCHATMIQFATDGDEGLTDLFEKGQMQALYLQADDAYGFGDPDEQVDDHIAFVLELSMMWAAASGRRSPTSIIN